MKAGRYKLHNGTHITVTTVRYHRNGVAGQGFYAARFTYEDVEYVGIVADPYEYGEVYVIDPTNLGNTMRGADWFGPALSRAVQQRRNEAFGWYIEERGAA